MMRDLIPSINSPHLDYFEDLFANTNYSQKKIERIFFTLNCVSIAEGCTHQCTFCVLNTPSTLKYMPYFTILKIADAYKKYTGNFGPRLINLINEIDNGRINIKDFAEFIKLNEKRISLGYEDYHYPSKFIRNLDILLGTNIGTENYKNKFVNEKYRQFKNLLIKELSNVMNFRLSELKKLVNSQRPHLLNYYRCDPFDYRFVFPDGSIADYGDVYKIFVDLGFSVDVATACWEIKNKIAQKAGEKVAQIGTSHPNHFYISYHRYSIQARQNFNRYLKSVLNVIKTILKYKSNKLLIRCEDRNKQLEKLLSVLIDKGTLISQNISKEQISDFINKDQDLIGKNITISKRYKEILKKDESGAIKLAGPSLGHSIDYNGFLYLRRNLKENYKQVGDIY